MRKLSDVGYSSEEIFRFGNPRGRMLDLGCGQGRHSNYMLSRGLQVLGLDMSIERLREAVVSIDVVEGDAYQLPFRDGTFDHVLCSEVLEHLDNPYCCLTEVHRVLRGWGAQFSLPLV